MKRIKEFDVAKTIATFSIICAHLSPITSKDIFSIKLSWLYNLFGIIGVPLFFFISGYLFFKNTDNFKKFMSKKTKQIIIPWIFIGTFCYLMVFYFKHNISFINYLKFIYGYGSYLYFLSVLLILYLINFKFKNNNIFLYSTLIIGIISLVLNIIFGINSFSYINFCNWIPYFTLGMIVSKNNKINDLFKFCKKNMLIFLIIFLVAFLYGFIKNIDINYWTFIGVIIIVSFWGMFFGIIYEKKLKINTFFGENSLAFYLIHMPIAGICVRIMNGYFIVFRFFLTLLITYVVIYLYKFFTKKLNLEKLNILIGVK